MFFGVEFQRHRAKSFSAIILALVTLSVLNCHVHAEYKTFTLSGSATNYPSETNFVVGPHIVVEFLGGSFEKVAGGFQAEHVKVSVLLPDKPGDTNGPSTEVDLKETRNSAWPTVIVGPCVIRFSVLKDLRFGQSPPDIAFYTIRIASQPGTFTPGGTVFIPSDAKGPVNILMESSTNLLDWKSALPGRYGVTSPERYFRLRAVVE